MKGTTVGYTTTFRGQVEINPPLNPQEVAYLKRFADSRREPYAHGPYVTDESAPRRFGGEENQEEVQPGFYCQWIPTDDGKALVWDGGEKFRAATEWMRYLIVTFLAPDAILRNELITNAYPSRYYPEEFVNFTFDHVANGVLEAQGEGVSDHWWLIVKDNEVDTRTLTDMLQDANKVTAAYLDDVNQAQDDADNKLAWLDDLDHEAKSTTVDNGPDYHVTCNHDPGFQCIECVPEDGFSFEPLGPSYADMVNAPLTEATAHEIGRQIASGDYPRFKRSTVHKTDRDGITTDVHVSQPVRRRSTSDDDPGWDAYAAAMADTDGADVIATLDAAVADGTAGTTVAPPVKPDQTWNLWSHKHQLWWAPNSKGYVNHQVEAGVYSTDEAVEIILHSMRGWFLGQNRAVPDTIMIPSQYNEHADDEW